MRSYADFRPAQVWGSGKIKQCFLGGASRLPGIILAWDMGAGKTGTTLKALRDLFDAFIIRKALVVAGLEVARVTWPDEFEEWDFARALTYTLLRAEDWDDPEIVEMRERVYREWLDILGPKLARQKSNKAVIAAKEAKMCRLAQEDTEIHIINREALPWLWKFFGQGKRWPYDVLVIDDVRETKSGRKRVKRGKTEEEDKKKGAPLSRFGIMAKARKFQDATIEFTGTPTPMGRRNLWGQAYLIDLGERLGTARTAFEKRWFIQDRWSYKWEERPCAAREIDERIKDIMFSLGPEHYPQFEVIPNIVKVRLDPKELAEYRKFERTLVSEAYDVEAVSSGVLANKLLQFANGSMYREDGKDVWIHDKKLEALERIMEEANGKPVLVAYSFKFDLARIRKRFPKAVVFGKGNVRETKRRWNAGEIELLLGHPASIGHGQNIAQGGHIDVWYGLTSDLELFLQFNKRLARPGQTMPVYRHFIVAEDTHDEDLLPLLSDKKVTQDDVMESTRVRLLGL